MRLDNYNNPIFSEHDVFNIMYEGNINVLANIQVDITDELTKLTDISDIDFITPIDPAISVKSLDNSRQQRWLMPDEYNSFDVYNYCLSKCNTELEKTRVTEEFEAFKLYKMEKVLQWLKYFVDSCTEHKIFWGVGRGSSVSSYILYLLGVHKINSIKYKLDWREFLR
jgi:DNA polymerase III alpha subunit